MRHVVFGLAGAFAGACTGPLKDGPSPRSIDARLVCPTGHGDCDGAPSNGCETDLSTDALNCRACGHACRRFHVAEGVCVDGRCTVLTCEQGFGDCDGRAENGCEGRLCRHSHGIECAPECGESAGYEF